MSFTKKKLLYLIKENLKEMAMDFDTQDRPDQGLQDKLSQGDTPLKKVPLPNTGDEPNKNFQKFIFLILNKGYINILIIIVCKIKMISLTHITEAELRQFYLLEGKISGRDKEINIQNLTLIRYKKPIIIIT